MADRLHILIDGRVQGVFFRHTTAEEARKRGLTGWVKNRSDGRVEAEFEGPKNELEDMLEWCRHGPPHADVAHVDSRWESGPERHDAFRVRY